MFRGDALGRLATDSHVPFVREYCESVLRWTDGKSAITNSKFNQKNWSVYESTHEYDASTIEYVCGLYSLTREDFEDFRTFLRELKREDMLVHPVMEKIMAVDVGSCDPVRTGLYSDALGIPQDLSQTPERAWTLSMPSQTPAPSRVEQILRVGVGAPLSEEASKLLIPFILLFAFSFLPSWVVTIISYVYMAIVSTVIAAFESSNMLGIDLVEFAVRFGIHFFMAWFGYVFMCAYGPAGFIAALSLHASNNVFAVYGINFPVFTPALQWAGGHRLMASLAHVLVELGVAAPELLMLRSGFIPFSKTFGWRNATVFVVTGRYLSVPAAPEALNIIFECSRLVALEASRLAGLISFHPIALLLRRTLSALKGALASLSRTMLSWLPRRTFVRPRGRRSRKASSRVSRCSGRISIRLIRLSRVSSSQISARSPVSLSPSPVQLDSLPTPMVELRARSPPMARTSSSSRMRPQVLMLSPTPGTQEPLADSPSPIGLLSSPPFPCIASSPQASA